MRDLSLDQLDINGVPIGVRLVDDRPAVEVQALAAVRTAAVLDCITRLKPRSREIVTLLLDLERDRLGVNLIARQLGVSKAVASEERDYALFQLEYLVSTHRHAALLAA